MKHISFLILSAFLSVVTLAQNGGGGADLDVKITKNDGGGSFPWLWVVIGLVVLVLLVALLNSGRGGSSRTTVIKD
jgi:hypothetical protein